MVPPTPIPVPSNPAPKTSIEPGPLAAAASIRESMLKYARLIDRDLANLKNSIRPENLTAEVDVQDLVTKVEHFKNLAFALDVASVSERLDALASTHNTLSQTANGARDEIVALRELLEQVVRARLVAVGASGI